jgi:short-subunit dehydrogenase
MLRLLGLNYVAPQDLRGKKIWIIGASSGLGAALAKQCAADGAVVALSARRLPLLEAVHQEMAGSGHEIAVLDVTDMASFQRGFRKVLQAFGRIDTVIYASGIRPVPDWQRFNAKEQLEGLDVNLGGVLRLLEIMMPQWQQQGGGQLLLIGSLIATGAMPLAGVYGASKAGLAYLAENLAMDLHPLGVQVQLASPGFIETPLTAFRPREQMPLLMQPMQAARKIRHVMGREDVFDIHYPKLLSVPTRLLRWMLPRLWWRDLLLYADKRSKEKAARNA